jgi:hypothetical protein
MLYTIGNAAHTKALAATTLHVTCVSVCVCVRERVCVLVCVRESVSVREIGCVCVMYAVMEDSKLDFVGKQILGWVCVCTYVLTSPYFKFYFFILAEQRIHFSLRN